MVYLAAVGELLAVLMNVFPQRIDWLAVASPDRLNTPLQTLIRSMSRVLFTGVSSTVR
jgi:hypothetical protein